MSPLPPIGYLSYDDEPPIQRSRDYPIKVKILIHILFEEKQSKEVEHKMETPKEWQATTDLGDPTYWLSYEYEQMQVEMQKLNEKMDLILCILQKKPKKTTILDVDKKVDSLINILDKKRKIEE